MQLFIHTVNMTILELDFRYSYYQHTLAHVNVYTSDFYSKLCAGISEEEMNEMKIEIDRYGIITNRSIIKKIWDACLAHGYIMGHQDFLGSYVGLIILK